MQLACLTDHQVSGCACVHEYDVHTVVKVVVTTVYVGVAYQRDGE